jgi:hypothetical protein
VFTAEITVRLQEIFTIVGNGAHAEHDWALFLPLIQAHSLEVVEFHRYFAAQQSILFKKPLGETGGFGKSLSIFFL